MPVPLPKKPLVDHCSALRNNTLYTFSEDAFQSLELKNGSEWKTLPMAVGTSGAACVLAHRGTTDEALYIVGGATRNPERTPTKGFMGLQRWVFARKVWENVVLPDPVTYNLTNHGAAFLEATQRLIVFAGTAWPAVNIPSANTFLIQTAAPNEITSIPAREALLAPIVLPWERNGALVVGGNGDNTALDTYSTDAGWVTLGAKLAHGMHNRGETVASLMDGDDGSRVLMVFDLNDTPARVQMTKVKDPVATTAAGSRKTTRRDGKGTGANPPVSTEDQLSADNWPKYNATGAPKAARSGTSLAYAGDMVVISGGDEQEPLLMFNTRKNSWVSAESVLLADSQESVSRTRPRESSSRTVSTLPTASQTAASTPASASASASAAAGRTRVGPNTVQSLFIVLGSILGAALILGTCFYYLKRRRQRRDLGKRRAADAGDGDRMSFQDRGASFMKEAGGDLYMVPPPSRSMPFQNENNSWLNVQRQASARIGASDGSIGANPPRANHNFRNGPTVQRVGGQAVIVHPGQEVPLGGASQAPNKESRGSGWSRYFSGNSATNLVASPARVHSEAQSSVYTDASSVHQNPFLHNAGPGVAAGGMGVVSIQRGGSNGIILQDPMIRGQAQQQQQQQQYYQHHERRGSDISMSSIGGDSYSSGVPESLTEKPLWSQLDRERSKNPYVRNAIPSSVYAESSSDARRDTEWSSRYDSGAPAQSHHEGVDNLSWLNLRSN